MREPALLENLKTHPGGHRGLRRFDPRCRALWRLLVNQAGADFTLTFNKSAAAALLGVHRNTVNSWLQFFQHFGLLTIHGQRGALGVAITVTWLERGQALAARRQRAEELAKTDHVKPQPKGICGDGAQHKDTSLTPYGDSTNRASAMKAVRTVLTARIHDPSVATEATRAIGRWVWKRKPTVASIGAVLSALQKAQRIPVPRWVKCAADVHRWMRSLIAKLLRYGAAWWGRLRGFVERRRLKMVLAGIQRAVAEDKPCPVCGAKHTKADWREGRDKYGRLTCPGWVRVRLSELLPQAPERPRRETNEDLQRRWEDERREFRTPLWWYQ